MVVRHPVASDDQPNAIVATPAMHKHRPSLRVLKYAQDFGDLVVFRRPDPGETYADVLHTGCFHQLSFPGHVKSAAAQIEHRLNTHLCQLRISLLVWLFAAIDVIVYTGEVRHLPSHTEAENQQ